MVLCGYLMEGDSPFSDEPVVVLDEVFPGHTNALNTLFGGRLMAIMDTAAVIHLNNIRGQRLH